ncbi:hypothetical protein ONR57_20730 [Hoyosella sp. YIM 151337]|uniref:hypothetical protein n=1 Tax=Hoyosella sp. YIM 151337 TaxID=2992742 RepID=UPI0022364811|nr:hypothetical protein [Hoyosella sp. YIM 151337]MCW4355735.1 hypothetical protein [Hoyosella sp. YIM 151337]
MSPHFREVLVLEKDTLPTEPAARSGVGDTTFRDLVISRIVDPTSLLDTGRVLTGLDSIR